MQSEARRPTRATIDLRNLTANLHSIKDFIGSEPACMAVVKADAYGHGAVQCASALESAGIDWFGVALPEEGIELRRAGISKPILCLGSFFDGQANAVLSNQLTSVIFSLERASQLNDAASEIGVIADVHLKVDTGMNRLGVRHDQLESFLDSFKLFENLRLDGLMTHFAAADNIAQPEFTNLQIERFNHCLKLVRDRGFNPSYYDLANSPGAICHPRSLGNMVRLGGILYGLGDDVLPTEARKPELRPVMSVTSEIGLLKRVPKGEGLGYSLTHRLKRDSIIATIPIGYEDGYPRQLSNRSSVIVNGVFAPVVGRVSMDWTIVDVTDVPNVKEGDEIVLIGERDGLRVKAEDLAKWADTISYEITCGIHRRVPKVFVE